MKTIKFTAQELEILRYYMMENICHAGCVLPEMKNKKIDCDKCIVTKIINNLENKIGDNE